MYGWLRGAGGGNLQTVAGYSRYDSKWPCSSCFLAQHKRLDGMEPFLHHCAACCRIQGDRWLRVWRRGVPPTGRAQAPRSMSRLAADLINVPCDLQPGLRLGTCTHGYVVQPGLGPQPPAIQAPLDKAPPLPVCPRALDTPTHVLAPISSRALRFDGFNTSSIISTTNSRPQTRPGPCGWLLVCPAVCLVVSIFFFPSFFPSSRARPLCRAANAAPDRPT